MFHKYLDTDRIQQEFFIGEVPRHDLEQKFQLTPEELQTVLDMPFTNPKLIKLQSINSVLQLVRQHYGYVDDKFKKELEMTL